ncbi:MAG: M48 family metalloprotease [Gammaproteobacteria bacterium]|nr:M48 family metalloprotease [Gammaproteobacteria bacterium]
MWILAAALLAGLSFGVFLGLVRARGRGGEEPPTRRRRAAQLASFAFAMGVSLAALQGILFLIRQSHGHLPQPTPPPLFGAQLGLVLYLLGRVLLLDLARWSFHWAVRAPERFDRTWRMEATSIAWGLVAWPCLGAITLSLGYLYDTLSFLVLPMVVAVPLFYETWLHPWLQYWKSRRLGDTAHEELEDWLAGVSARHRTPRFRVRIHRGLEKNAFAMGGLLRHLVVVGGGLAEAMTTEQLKAILAHEIAHVMRRDVLRLVGAVLVGGTCFVTLHLELVSPNIDRSTTTGFLLGMTFVAVAFPLFYVVAPGLLSRRLEYGADRLAVRLLGRGDAMVDALTRLHEIRNIPLDKKSLTHPTGAQRIAAIRELGSAADTSRPGERRDLTSPWSK